MNDATPPPPRKAVKRVVKKTVVRPVSAKRGAASAPAPPKKAVASRPTRVGTITAPHPAPAPAAKPKAPKTSGAAKAKVGAAGRSVGRAARGVGRGVGTLARGTAGTTRRTWRRVRSWRIPQVEPTRAALLTGATCGLVATLLGIAATQMFSVVRGVAGGGGRWGTLTFVVVAFIAFALGEYLLTAFGGRSARVTSFLGVCFTLVLILAFLLKPADSAWALLVVPAAAAVAFLGAGRLVTIAENEPVKD